MKKFISFLLVMLIALSVFQTAISAQSVEIKFAVGDDTLIINGQPVTVEKPYVVGEGVTLVPIRVITEAFGAEVGWDGDTKTVTLSYPDVNISLQIGNPVAEINGRAETLLAAPELTNGYTMIPLRFISENFGAEVSYEAETGYITVIKNNAEEGSIVEGSIESKYVGDSYYNWTIETPADMQMEYRSFDGSYTLFSYDDDTFFEVMIEEKNEEYNFEKAFSEYKNTLKEYTLAVADKNDTKRDKDMHLQAKDKNIIIDYYEFETVDYIYSVSGIISTDCKIKDEVLRIISTFCPSFSAEDAYDLSNVKDGSRRFESDIMKVSFDVPQDFLMISDEDAENSFVFASVDKSSKVDSQISVMAFSKSDVGSADSLASTDYNWNKENLSGTCVSFEGKVTQKNYTGISAFEYAYNVKSTDASFYCRDVFFEKGEYVYNASIEISAATDEAESMANAFFNSITVEEADPAVAGIILRNFDELEGTTKINDVEHCFINIPNAYTKIETSSEKEFMYYDELRGTTISISYLNDKKYTAKGVDELAKQSLSQAKKDGGTELRRVSSGTLGGKTGSEFAYKKTTDGQTFCVEVKMFVHRDKCYTFIAIYPELMFSEKARSIFDSITNSIYFF